MQTIARKRVLWYSMRKPIPTMLRHPLVRQVIGAVIGATAAAGLYGAYAGAAQLIGADPVDSLTAAVLGEQVARIVEPLDEPAPLPELGVPAQVRATPTPPPPQRKPVPAESDADSLDIMIENTAEPMVAEPVMDPLPVAAEVVSSSSSSAAAAPTATSKASALPSSGASEWLLLSSALGAAVGWHRRRLSALFA